MTVNSVILNFDANKVAHYEKENWVSYYNKDWTKLLVVSVAMVKHAFALPWWKAVYGAYLYTAS